MNRTIPARVASWLLVALVGASCATSSATAPAPATPAPATPTPTPTSPEAPTPASPEAPTPASPEASPQAPRTGGDRDAHGCIGSAGYSWCARENRCVRPWEVAREHNLPRGGDATENRRAFESYCNGS